MFIFKVCGVLKENKVPYAIVGGMAVALHGVVRGTVDVDIIIRWTEKNLLLAEKALKSLGLESRVPVGAKEVFHFREEYIKNKKLITWKFFHPLRPSDQVDLLLTEDLKNYKAQTLKLPAGSLRILSLGDLVKMKKAAGRPQDKEDVKALEKLL